MSLSYTQEKKTTKKVRRWKVKPEFCSDCKQHFRKQHLEAIDLIVNSITVRFDQVGYKNLQNLLIQAIKMKKNYYLLQVSMEMIFILPN